MGLFSRKKTPKTAAGSKPALDFSISSIVGSGSHRLSPTNSSSNTTTQTSQTAPISLHTPLTPYSPYLAPPSPFVQIPKMDLPKPPDPRLDPAGYLRSLPAVRERSRIVTEKALANRLAHFDVDMAKFPDVVAFVAGIIKRDYDAPFTSIPPHGRYQHFCVCGKDRIATLLDSFGESVDANERCRRLLDLFLVSVLLDAGAGTQWSYRTSAADGGRVYRRSEGIAVASLEMFRQGLFSGIPEQNPYQVDKEGLRRLTVEKLAEGLQSKPGNEIAGIEGRASLLLNLAEALDEKKEFFGADGRPGNMLDHLLAHPATQAAAAPVVPLPVLWNVLINGLASIWPASRTVIDGVSLGDSWPCSSMPQVGGTTMVPASPTSPTSAGSNGAANGGAAVAHPTEPWEAILPFHKLTQWLTYSLMQPLSSLAGVRFAGTELLTGLPEYRNGGLFIDLGVLTLKPQDLERGLQNFADYCLRTGVKGVEVAPMFEPGDDVVVEWRGVTVGFLDKLVVEVNKALKNELAGHELSLAQVLEAGSWKGGREIAEINRPNTKEPPILIDSDGTVF